MLDIRYMRIGTAVEVRVPDTDDVWELATVSNGRAVVWRGREWVFSPVDVRLPEAQRVAS
jgi:hypothetical protein